MQRLKYSGNRVNDARLRIGERPGLIFRSAA
jgi:hypothetical protein